MQFDSTQVQRREVVLYMLTELIQLLVSYTSAVKMVEYPNDCQVFCQLIHVIHSPNANGYDM